jgi:hypothetical protein
MKFYVVVRLPKPGEEVPKDLPVRFTDFLTAEEMCNHLNDTKEDDQVGYVVQERTGTN